MEKYIQEYNEMGGTPNNRPEIPRYIGECFLKIANNLSNIFRFSGYSFKQEMISDGIFDCVRYLHKFDPNKTKNPFAYFTQICYWAFVRKIEAEKEYLYRKYKIIIHSEVFGLLNDNQSGDDGHQLDDIGSSENTKLNMYNFIDDFETRKEEKRLKKEQKETEELENG